LAHIARTLSHGLVAHRSVDYSTRGACGAQRPVRQTGGCRLRWLCDQAGGVAASDGVRQTLSDGA